MNTHIADTISEVIVDNDHATLRYYPDSRIIHHVFHQPTQGEAFRNLVEAGVEVMRTRGATKWLSDDRKNAVIPEADTVWGKDHWFPQALEAGWKYWALVLPEDITVRLNLKQFTDAFSLEGVRIMVFTMPEDAMEWLSTVGVTD